MNPLAYFDPDDSIRTIPTPRAMDSQRLGIRFALTPETLEIFGPNGRPFLTSIELARRADQATARAQEQATLAQQEHERAERLAARLRALGIDPDADI